MIITTVIPIFIRLRVVSRDSTSDSPLSAAYINRLDNSLIPTILSTEGLFPYKGLKCTSDKPLTECLEEANPVYGKSPSLEKIVGVKLLSNLLIYAALTDESDLISRKTSLNLLNMGITVVIINNQIVINRHF